MTEPYAAAAAQSGMTDEQFLQAMHYFMTSQSRELDEGDLSVWWDVLGDLPFDLVMAALRTVARSAERYVSPAVVRGTALSEATQRLKAAGREPAPPSRLSVEEYLAFLQGWRAAVVAGERPAKAHQMALEAVRPGAQIKAPKRHVQIALPTPGAAVEGRVLD